MLVAASAVLGASPAYGADDEPGVLCRFDDQRLDEISAMAWSQLDPDRLWLLNDSSGGPFLYAVDATSCRTLARVRLAGPARDYESLASGRDAQGRPTLWVGDTGDNLPAWPYVRVLQVREPEQVRDGQRLPVRELRITYPERPRDAETLLALPTRPRLWVVGKSLLAGTVFALPGLVVRGSAQGRPIAELGGMITDGAVSADASRTVLRDYVWAWVYPGAPSRATFAAEPVRVSLPNQPQGEAVTWGRDGRSLLLASERDDRLLRVELPREAWTQAALDADAGGTPAPSGQPPAPGPSSPDAAPVDEGPSPWAVAGAAVLVGAAVAAFVVGARRLRR